MLLIVSSASYSKNALVNSAAQLQAAIKNANAGDNIILENGVYKDLRIDFYGQGTEENPITLKAETPGKVFIEGESNLQIGGSYLYVEGLHFRNGYTPTRTAVSYTHLTLPTILLV